MEKTKTHIKNMKRRMNCKCYDVCPSATNPRKTLIKDYSSRAIIFKDKEDIIKVATAMLVAADTEEIEQENKLLHITVYTKKNPNQNGQKGYNVEVSICGTDKDR